MIHIYKVYIIRNSELLNMMIKEDEIGIHPLFSSKKNYIIHLHKVDIYIQRHT